MAGLDIAEQLPERACKALRAGTSLRRFARTDHVDERSDGVVVVARILREQRERVRGGRSGPRVESSSEGHVCKERRG
jgi:hypothetical protein